LKPLERGLAEREAREFYIVSAQAAALLAYAYARCGRLSDSLPLLEWVIELALHQEFRAGQSRLLVLLGEVHLLAGRVDEATRFAERPS
jgi:hypothetical protein